MASTGSSGGSDLSKMYGGLQGGGFGGTLATILIWILDMRHINVPPEIAVAMASLFTMALGAVGTYLKPHNPAGA